MSVYVIIELYNVLLQAQVHNLFILYTMCTVKITSIIHIVEENNKVLLFIKYI